jgi:hypothetical protein
VFHLALRQTEVLISSIVGLLGLALAVPDHSTLSRLAQTLEVPRPRSSNGANGEPVLLLVDSTGLNDVDDASRAGPLLDQVVGPVGSFTGEPLSSAQDCKSNALCPLAALPWKRPNIGSRHCQLSHPWYARYVGGAAARVGRSFARLLCCPALTERGRKKAPWVR